MFDGLTSKFGDIFDRLRKHGALSASDVSVAMREIRVALLEADVALPTVKEFVEKVNQAETSISTIEKLKLRKSINQLIGKYWNKGILIGGSDFENYVVKVEILLDTEGNIIGNIRPISPSVPFGRYAIAFREASNAIKAVGKIPIPSEKYKKGLKLKLTFDPALGIGFD